MLDVARLLKRLEKLTIDNSPAILTAVGVAGTIGTAVLTSKASFKAAKIIRDEQFKENVVALPMEHEDLATKEKVKLVWKEFVPPVSAGVATVAAIIGANHIHTRRAAAFAAAYSISEKQFSEYKEKALEKLGLKKEQELRDDIAQDHMTKNPVSGKTVIITDGGDVLCYDTFTGRYFKSSMESIKKAENDVNFQILHDGEASVGDLHERLGLKPTPFSEEIGWNNDKPLEIQYSTVLSDDGRPCISIDFDVSTKRKYSHLAGE